MNSMMGMFNRGRNDEDSEYGGDSGDSDFEGPRGSNRHRGTEQHSGRHNGSRKSRHKRNKKGAGTTDEIVDKAKDEFWARRNFFKEATGSTFAGDVATGARVVILIFLAALLGVAANYFKSRADYTLASTGVPDQSGKPLTVLILLAIAVTYNAGALIFPFWHQIAELDTGVGKCFTLMALMDLAIGVALVIAGSKLGSIVPFVVCSTLPSATTKRNTYGQFGDISFQSWTYSTLGRCNLGKASIAFCVIPGALLLGTSFMMCCVFRKGAKRANEYDGSRKHRRDEEGRGSRHDSREMGDIGVGRAPMRAGNVGGGYEAY